MEFVQPPAVPAPVPANPLAGHIIHVGYIIHDPAKEDAFYETLLGFRPYWSGGFEGKPAEWISIQVPDGTDWLEYMVQPGPPDRGIPDAMNQGTAGVLDHFSLGVANIRDTVTLLTAADRISGKSDGPKIGRDGKWQYNLYDPDGAGYDTENRIAKSRYRSGSLAVNGEQHGFATAWNSMISARVPSGS